MQVIGSYDNILHLLQYEAKSIKLFSKEKQSSNIFLSPCFSNDGKRKYKFWKLKNDIECIRWYMENNSYPLAHFCPKYDFLCRNKIPNS